jgi:predicted nucleic acid-binding protein
VGAPFPIQIKAGAAAPVIVVADTTPLNYLIRLGLPDVLQEFYGRVLVPPAVLSEMRHPDAPAAVRAWALSPPAWLEETPVGELDVTLAENLGMGERQAISLALEIHADVLLIDEQAGRRQAEERHIFVTGTLTVLLKASLRGYCDFSEKIKQLREYGFWVSAATVAFMLDRYEKAKKQG